MQPSTNLRFANKHRDFAATLNKRVSEYFTGNKISRHANTEMVVKTICMFSLYFLPYGLIVSGAVTGGGWLLLLTAIMGLGFAGIGLSVMHDANHGAYSKKKWVNTLIGYSLNLIGGHAFNWKMQHNVLHHSFTNVHGEDEDISPRGVLRFSPHTEWKKMHAFQHIYAWFLYGLLTIAWIFAKDFVRIGRYHKMGLTHKHKADIRREWVILISSKLLYVGYIFVVPLLFTSLTAGQILLGVFVKHYVAGFILAIIFQPAHVVEETEYPLPDEKNSMENNWAAHQLFTTCNFGNNNRLLSWYAGGLNFQVEHHLFPSVCHVHYRNIAGIVKQTAHEFSLPYNSTETFSGALASHARLMRRLGTRPVNAGIVI